MARKTPRPGFAGSIFSRRVYRARPDCIHRPPEQEGRLWHSISRHCGTLRRIAGDSKHLGAVIGFLAVLHSWGQTCNIIPTFTASSPAAACRPTAVAGFIVARVSFSPFACSPAFSEACFSTTSKRPAPRASSHSMGRFSLWPIGKTSRPL